MDNKKTYTKEEEELGKKTILGFCYIIQFFLVALICFELYKVIAVLVGLPALSYWFFAGAIYVIKYFIKGVGGK